MTVVATTEPTTPATPYVDALGRTQYAVDGPNGHFLITRKRDGQPWEVWKSDSLSTRYSARDLDACIRAASRYAGLAE